MLLGFSVTVWGFAGLIARLRNSSLHNATLQNSTLRKVVFSSAILFCLGYLGILKYFDFFRESLQDALVASGFAASFPTIDLLMPIGVSFYTFNAIAYLVAVFRGERQSAGALSDFLLFMAFFPSLLAGPILRPEGVLSQIESSAPRQVIEPAFAIWLLVLGVFKKLVVASWLASIWVDPVFADPSAFNPIDLMVGCMAYSLQIFCDFSGYTDVVTGLALLLGYQLPVNFRQPYLANSIKVFWHRWHISLSSFIGDYLYRPLGGSRCSFLRTQLNVLIAFVLSGLWHGADTRYLLWGLLHGLGVAVCNAWSALKMPALPRWLGTLATFLFVSAAWVLFRADSYSVALEFYRAMMSFELPVQFNALVAAMLLAGFFLASAYSARIEGVVLSALRQRSMLLRCGFVVTLMLLLLELGPAGMPTFIYFKY